MEALELRVRGDLCLIDVRAGQTFLLECVGQSTRDKDRWKRLNDIIAKPTLKLVVQLVNDRRMARCIGNGLDSPSSGDFGAEDVFAHTAVRLPRLAAVCGHRILGKMLAIEGWDPSPSAPQSSRVRPSVADDCPAVGAPPVAIRPLALAVIRSSDRILVFRGEDPVKAEVFYRPLGGGIEFGETGETAVRREIREEIGAELVNIRPLGALENIFTYKGGPGHEIILLFEADLLDGAIYQVEQFEGLEANGDALFVTWKPLVDFRGGDRLYPEGLLPLLDANR